jgi:hypothetical protein
MAEESCLAGCAATYKCGQLQLPGPAGQQAESFAPWVWVKIGSGDPITVGNESYPPNNEACIKSFEVGWISKPTVQVEIMDQAGGRMGVLLDALAKCPARGVGDGTEIKFQFGWIINDCQGNKQVIPSLIFKSIITKLEVNYSEGKVKYKIYGDTADVLLEGMRDNEPIGTDDQKVNIETAIRTICSRSPQVNVRFKKRQADGKFVDTEFNWRGYGKGGPLGAWQSDNSNRMAVITKWMEPFRIDDGTPDGAGLAIAWLPYESNTMVVFQDVLKGENSDCPDSPTMGGPDRTDGNIGSFIVNGGKCSPVIEFSPTYDWVSATQNLSAGGGTSGPGNTANQNMVDAKIEGKDKDCGQLVGLQQQLTITQQSWESYGPKNAWKELMKSQRAHLLAGMVVGTKTEMEADLKILGDPRPAFCGMPGGRRVAIIAINPFHIGGDGCGSWLAEPGCNPIMSNKNWRVTGINHSIQSGSYTTTLKVTLPAQGVNIYRNEPLGGSGSGGPIVKNT